MAQVQIKFVFVFSASFKDLKVPILRSLKSTNFKES